MYGLPLAKGSWLGRFLASYWKNLFSTFLFAVFGVVLIVFAYVYMSLQAMWAPPADALLPTKVAVIVGVGTWISATTYGLYRAVTKGEWLVGLFSIVSTLLTIGSLVTYYKPLATFFASTIPLALGDDVLPLNIKLLVSVAYTIPIIFIALSLVLFFLAIMAKTVIEAFTKWLKSAVNETRNEKSGQASQRNA